jgi:hypothetical protein
MTSTLAEMRPDLAGQWHPTRNGILTPDTVPAETRRRAWWVCPRGHEYEVNVAARVQDGAACPECHPWQRRH